MSSATIYHLAHDKHRRGGGLSTTTGDPLNMPDAEGKLDRLATSLHGIELTLAGIDSKLERVVEDNADHEQRLRSLEGKPRGVTPRELWAVVTSAVATLGIVLAIIERLTN